jgi:glycine/D-amino acid oxidase-like deaminating enzyme
MAEANRPMAEADRPMAEADRPTAEADRPTAGADPAVRPSIPGRSAVPYERRVFWHTTVPDRPSFRDRPLPERTDVAIVGGGYTGLTAAIHLARAGARVALLERHELGWGASSRNGGFVHGGLRVGRKGLVRRYGPELGVRLHRAGQEAFPAAERFILGEGLDCEYSRSGTLVLAWSPAHLRRLAAEAEELIGEGRTARFVPRETLHEEIGTDEYPGALLDEESGGLNPARYLAALVAKAVEVGVDLHEGSPATRLERSDSGVRVDTPTGSVVARDVVIATEGYADDLLPWLRRRIIPIGSYIVATGPLPEAAAREISPRGRMFYDSKNFLYYWRLTPDRRLLFGGRASFVPTTVDRTAAILSRAMHRVHPQLGDARVEYAWGGTIGFTFDELPHIAQRGRVLVGGGYAGSGVAMATYFGELLARRLAAGTETAVEPSPFEEIPYPGAPLIPRLYGGRPWFLPIAGEFFRFRDWWSRHGILAR